MFMATVTRALSCLGLDPRGTAPFPRSTAPMLMHKADRLVSSPDWTYEPKWNGFRVIATVRDGSVRLLSRNGHSFTRLFGPVSDARRSFPASLVLDGEVVVDYRRRLAGLRGALVAAQAARRKVARSCLLSDLRLFVREEIMSTTANTKGE